MVSLILPLWIDQDDINRSFQGQMDWILSHNYEAFTVVLSVNVSHRKKLLITISGLGLAPQNMTNFVDQYVVDRN